MLKRRIFIFLGLLWVVGLVYYFIELRIPQKYIVTINGISLEVDVAHTDYLRKAGLMGKSVLSEYQGMLFIFPDEDIRSFWMKNTFIPLSIAFIRSDGKITQIMDMQPENWQGKLPSYISSEKVKYALEVNQGWFIRNGAREGNKVHFSRSIRNLSIE